MTDVEVQELADFVVASVNWANTPLRAKAINEVVRSIEGGAYGDGVFAARNPTLPTLCQEWLQGLAVAFDDRPGYREEWRP